MDMKIQKTFVKVRYAETDQMGVVHHGNYPQYCEIARIDWLESLGISYKSMEEEGVMLPVYEMNFRFIKPATFDQVLRIETHIRETPGVRIRFYYSIFDEKNELITTATTVLVFMDSLTKRPVRCPGYILERLKI